MYNSCNREINIYFSYKGFLFKELSFELLFIPSPTKLRRDIVTLPSVRHILVNTLESTSFNGFWPIIKIYLTWSCIQSFEYFFHSFKIYLNNIYLTTNGALCNAQNVHIHIYIYSSISLNIFKLYYQHYHFIMLVNC
jgi:hypothetical protein